MWCPGRNNVVSIWKPCDVHIWSYVVSIWKPHGVHMGTMWWPYCVHIETTWCLHWNHVVTTWTPSGIHVNTMWLPVLSFPLFEMTVSFPFQSNLTPMSCDHHKLTNQEPWFIEISQVLSASRRHLRDFVRLHPKLHSHLKSKAVKTALLKIQISVCPEDIYFALIGCSTSPNKVGEWLVLFLKYFNCANDTHWIHPSTKFSATAFWSR